MLLAILVNYAIIDDSGIYTLQRKVMERRLSPVALIHCGRILIIFLSGIRRKRVVRKPKRVRDSAW
jgi:hypothetical protein